MMTQEQEQAVQQRTEIRIGQTIGALVVQRDMLLAQTEVLREEIAALKAKLAEAEKPSDG